MPSIDDDPPHEGRHRRGRAGPVGEVDGVDLGDRSDAAQAVQTVHTAQAVPLVTVPGALRSAQVGVGSRAVRGVLLLLLAISLSLGARWWWVEQQATAVPTVATGWADPERPEEEATGVQQGQGDDEPDPTAPPTPAPVLVHVVGEVRSPGVVELPAGARVSDAVEAAGGLTGEADAGSLNLARPVVDGEQVWVGAPGEEPPASAGPAPGAGVAGSAGGAGAGAAAGGSSAAGAGGSGATSGSPNPVDLNTATGPQLEELPGVGPVTAGRILAWREEHGRFTDVTELLEVSGIGERTLEQLEPWVVVSG